MIEMFTAAVLLDAQTNNPIVILEDMEKRRALPIWIGIAEASAIGAVLEGVKPKRPLTHDLLLNVIRQLKYKVLQVDINELNDKTYLATIRLGRDGDGVAGEHEESIDSRPSDAIALALRANVPIFVSEEVMAQASMAVDDKKDEQEAREFSDFLQNIKASDFHIEGHSESE